MQSLKTARVFACLTRSLGWIHPEKINLDEILKVLREIEEKCVAQEEQVYFSGEGDGSQTKFEICTVSRSETVGLVLLRILRYIVDKNHGLLKIDLESLHGEEGEDQAEDLAREMFEKTRVPTEKCSAHYLFTLSLATRELTYLVKMPNHEKAKKYSLNDFKIVKNRFSLR